MITVAAVTVTDSVSARLSPHVPALLLLRLQLPDDVCVLDRPLRRHLSGVVCRLLRQVLQETSHVIGQVDCRGSVTDEWNEEVAVTTHCVCVC